MKGAYFTLFFCLFLSRKKHSRTRGDEEGEGGERKSSSRRRSKPTTEVKQEPMDDNTTDTTVAPGDPPNAPEAPTGDA